MEDKNITFEDLPKAMSWMMDKLNKLDSKIDGLNNIPQVRPADQWMSLKELCEYLPSHPAEQTVYGWTSCHQIPFHKRGKRIMFLKSEIDAWLHDGKRKSQKELAEEAAQFINAKLNSRVSRGNQPNVRRKQSNNVAITRTSASATTILRFIDQSPFKL